MSSLNLSKQTIVLSMVEGSSFCLPLDFGKVDDDKNIYRDLYEFLKRKATSSSEVWSELGRRGRTIVGILKMRIFEFLTQI